MLLVASQFLGISRMDEQDNRVGFRFLPLFRRFADEFKDHTGSIICRKMLELAGVEKDKSFEPEIRTEKYYKKRPCRRIIELSAEIVDKIIEEKGVPKK